MSIQKRELEQLLSKLRRRRGSREIDLKFLTELVDLMESSQTTRLEQTLLDLIGGDVSTVFNPVSNAVPSSARLTQGLLQKAFTSLFSHRSVSTSVAESQRSRQAGKDYRLSRSQQAAFLAQMAERGSRNL